MKFTKCENNQLKRNKNIIYFNKSFDVYIMLSDFLKYRIDFFYNEITKKRKKTKKKNINFPYIIGITGSVAVGKSTISKILQFLLKKWKKNHTVELVTTDNFLYSNKILQEKKLIDKKGFPESYNIKKLISFVKRIKSGKKKSIVPIYSHFLCDIIPNKKKIIFNPDILILEGLNILQNKNNNQKINICNISSFIDLSIYINATEKLLKNWYIKRFLKLHKLSFSNPLSYFYKYSNFSKEKIIFIANKIWKEINRKNLKENILPTRKHANLILNKIDNHVISSIFFQK